MEHYVSCSRLFSPHSGLAIPWIMAFYTQRCLICHSVEVGVAARTRRKATTLSPVLYHPPHPFCPVKEKLMFTQFNLNECCSCRERSLLSAELRQRRMPLPLCQQIDGAVLGGWGEDEEMGVKDREVWVTDEWHLHLSSQPGVLAGLEGEQRQKEIRWKWKGMNKRNRTRGKGRKRKQQMIEKENKEMKNQGNKTGRWGVKKGNDWKETMGGEQGKGKKVEMKKYQETREGMKMKKELKCKARKRRKEGRKEEKSKTDSLRHLDWHWCNFLVLSAVIVL